MPADHPSPRRWFLSFPAFRTVEDVEAHCNRLGVVRVGDYRGYDGLRCLVEMPTAAMDRLAGEAFTLLRVVVDEIPPGCIFQYSIPKRTAEDIATLERLGLL